MKKQARGRRGSALILTLFLLIVLQLIGLSFLSRVQGEMAMTTRDVTTLYLLQSALADTRAWLENRQNANLLDASIQALPSGTDPDEPPAMRKYYQRVSTSVGATTPSGWTWRVRIFPDQWTEGNGNLQGNNSDHCYKLVLDAIDTHSLAGQTVRRRGTAWLHQGSFAQFSYFYGQMAAGSSLWLNMGTFRVEGPFHTNGPLRLSIPYTGTEWANLGPGNSGSTAPFQDISTFGVVDSTTPDGITYNTANLPYDSSGMPSTQNMPTGKNRYDRLARMGRAGIKSDTVINMPAVSTLLAEAAWGDSTLPGNPRDGVNINPGNATTPLGTVPIKKNVNGVLLAGPDVEILQMQRGNDSKFPINVTSLRGSDNSNESFLLRQGTGTSAKTRRITFTNRSTTSSPASTTVLNPGGTWTANGVSMTGSLSVPDGYTIVQNDTSLKAYEIYEGQGNGLIFDKPLANGSGGNIKGLEGMNAGRHTFAVDQMSNKEIYITDQLLRADTTAGSAPSTGSTRDQLGVVGYAIRFPTTRTDPNTGVASPINRSLWTTTSPMLIYAALFAGRPNDPNNTDTTAGGVGTISYGDTTYGAGSFKVFGSLTENIRQAKGTFNSTTGVATSGMNYQYSYDPNFQTVQPPYFPALSKFDLAAWSDQPILEDAARP